MQSDFKTVEITDVETLQVLLHPVVQNAFRSGGWIAGGFPRLVGRTILRPHRLDSTSSNKSKLFQCYFQNRGDIDFFFRNHDDFASAVTKGAYHQSAFAHNMWLHNREGVLSIKVQLVNKFYYDTVEQAFDSFDFLNSCYAIVQTNKKYYLTYDEGANDADIAKELVIKHANSPYTLQRIVTYLNDRGLEKVSKSSSKNLEELLVRSASEIFDKKYSFGLAKPYIKKSLDFIFSSGLVSPENAIFFIGKYKKVIEQKYGPTYVTDWASDIIEESANS